MHDTPEDPDNHCPQGSSPTTPTPSAMRGAKTSAESRCGGIGAWHCTKVVSKSPVFVLL